MKKILLLMTMVLTCVGAWAQITDANQLSNEKCYHITSRDANRGAFYAPAGAEYLTTCAGTYGNYPNGSIGKNANSTEQQFALIKKGDKFYLYSVSAKKFAKKDGNFIKLVDEPSDYVTVDKNGNYFNIKINGWYKLNFSGGYDHGVYANYNTDDDGNNLVITEAADFNPAEALSRIIEDNVVFNWTTSTTWTDVDVANYSSTIFNENALSYGIKCIEGKVIVGGARTATVRLDYTSGDCALNIRGIEVIDANDNVIAGDYHVGKAGAPSTNNVYTVKVAEAGTYKVRCYATFGPDDRADATNGTITISFAKENTANFSHGVEFKAEYATLHLGYKVAVPAGVEAYVVSGVENGYAMMTKVENVIPAATPVILKKVGAESSYAFAYTDAVATDVENNLLEGSIANRYVVAEACVLNNGSNGIGFYGAILNKVDNTAFLNNANKAYLPVTPQGANMLRFNFGGETTAIEAVEVENANAPIYDLTGRRVLSTVKGGIYIQNGKKFIVK